MCRTASHLKGQELERRSVVFVSTPTRFQLSGAEQSRLFVSPHFHGAMLTAEGNVVG